jgi:hypothetical protein
MDGFPVFPSLPQDFQSIADGRERVTEFVGQHCQELVLATVFLRRGLELQDFGNILDAQHDSCRMTAAAQGAGVQQHRALADAFKVVFDFEVIKRTIAG